MTDGRLPYSTKQLFGTRPQRTFTGEALREIAFPLGGIGTGCISLGGCGQLRDWEIFNRPEQGYQPDFTFVALRAETDDGRVVTKVVQSLVPPPYGQSFGASTTPGMGLPHFESNTFRGEYPFAWLEFKDAQMPLRVSLEAFSPFIPLNDLDSGLPAAVLTYRLENNTGGEVRVLLAAAVQNLVGHVGGRGSRERDHGQNRNIYRSEGGLSGVVMDSLKHAKDSAQYGSIVAATPWHSVTYTGDLRSRGFGVGHLFWDALHVRGAFDNEDRSDPTEDGRTATCVLAMRVTLGPGESAEVPLVIAWHFPNFVWHTHLWEGQTAPQSPPQWRNYYATQFGSAWDAAAYVHANLARLRADTMTYHDALFGSTLPAPVLDAASANTSTLKSCTCLRLEDGTFYGFEGCGHDAGCCEGSCTHVWNYQQALPFLFPALERSMRAADYRYNVREEDGGMCFRIGLPLGTTRWDFHACVDGQLGGIMKTYRDWLICGDDEWLRELWPAVKKSLAYTWEQWDKDRDGVIDGIQHNTYDIEFQGPNPLSGAFYMGALRAAEEMARHLGEHEQADEYRALFEKGSAALDRLCFNGDYYYQVYDPAQVSTQQFGTGCLSDQMLGQWIAALCGLGYVFDPEHVRAALHSVFEFNWRPSLRDHANVMRVYALGDEAGLLMASWPRGERPLVPTMYSDEVWTGIEYQVASHLIMEGFVEEGLCIVKGARDRFDGRRRNPWDEPECGSHYARAMSSWGLVTALSGFYCNASERLLQFAPRVNPGRFRCFWSDDAGWGTYGQKIGPERVEARLQLLYGEQSVSTLRLALPDGFGTARARLGRRQVKCVTERQGDWTLVRFPEPVEMRAPAALSVRFTSS